MLLLPERDGTTLTTWVIARDMIYRSYDLQRHLLVGSSLACICMPSIQPLRLPVQPRLPVEHMTEAVSHPLQRLAHFKLCSGFDEQRRGNEATIRSISM